MNQTIYKYEVGALGVTEIEGSITKFLTIQYQHNTRKMCLWALIDKDIPKKKYVIGCYGTGHEVDACVKGDDYIGTVQVMDGQMVLHYFAVAVDELMKRQKESQAEISPELEMEMS